MANGKAALFICKCGTNIANFVDLDEIAEWASARDDVAVVDTHNLFCSPDGKKRYQEVLKEKGVDSIIVAACSPKMHEKTFQGLAEELGINMSRVQMANIREQCAWVTPDKAEATEKAKELINAAIERSWLAEVLEKRSMEVNTDIMIIGGGMAGIEAALMASAAGRKVTIVEREISIGGEVIKMEEVAPNMECAPCLLAPRLSELKGDPNITVISNADIEAVLGFYGNFTVRVKKKARYVEDSCIGCEACFDVCPVDVKSDFHLGLGTHKAIYTMFAGSVPAAAAIDREHCKHFVDGSCDACVAACPFQSVNFDQQDEMIEINVGAIVVATGYSTLDPSVRESLGYGKIENVYTLPEFERIASSNGPYGSEIKLLNGEKPESIAVLHCPDSLFVESGAEYSDPVVNLAATKVGDYVRKQLPEIRIYNIHGDLAFASPKDLKFFNHQKHEGTCFVKCDDMAGVAISKNGKIKIEGPGFDALEVDMVVLATGMVPAKGAAELAGLLNIDLEVNGYPQADHTFLHATGSTLDGIYIAGAAGGPCDIGTAVTRGQAAAGDAVAKLQPGREIELEIMTSYIDDEKCGGCKLCITVCPYKAVSYDEERKVCYVNEAICRGCGTCTASCPSGASRARHFTDEQIFAEIGGILNG